MEVAAGTMDQLALQLSNTAGRPVIDKTGLQGLYTFQLNWLPASPTSAPSGPDVPDIFSAVREQLGLKLEPARAAISMLIIDEAERPSAN
jgi:uncharacterized protein (TIGR03435 family)